MIKILRIKQLDGFNLELDFSNGERALFTGDAYLAQRSGPLLDALRSVEFFQRCFIDAGALCWPNGFELSASRVLSLSNVLAENA